MKYRLSFANIDVISDNISEIIVDEGAEVTLEMCEEYDNFLLELFPHPFTTIVNKINDFTYTYEAALQLESLENCVATAVIVYSKRAENQANNFKSIRKQDNLNIHIFSGLDLGRRKSIEWVEGELSKVHCL